MLIPISKDTWVNVTQIAYVKIELHTVTFFLVNNVSLTVHVTNGEKFMEDFRSAERASYRK